MVFPSVGHDREPCKNGCTNQHAFLGCGLWWNDALDGSRFPVERCNFFRGKGTAHCKV